MQGDSPCTCSPRTCCCVYISSGAADLLNPLPITHRPAGRRLGSRLSMQLVSLGRHGSAGPTRTRDVTGSGGGGGGGGDVVKPQKSLRRSITIAVPISEPAVAAAASDGGLGAKGPGSPSRQGGSPFMCCLAPSEAAGAAAWRRILRPLPPRTVPCPTPPLPFSARRRIPGALGANAQLGAPRAGGAPG